MKLFAAINSSNIVTRTVVAGDSDTAPKCSLNEGETGWVEYSNNPPFLNKANTAAIGCEYRPTENVFCGLRPFSSWTLNTTSWVYEAPVTEPGADDIFITLNGVQTQLHHVIWDDDNTRWLGRIASSVEGKEDTHWDQYIWNADDSSWTFDSTIEM